MTFGAFSTTPTDSTPQKTPNPTHHHGVNNNFIEPIFLIENIITLPNTLSYKRQFLDRRGINRENFTIYAFKITIIPILICIFVMAH